MVAVALEERVMTARARATMDPKTAVRPLSAVPIPKIAPSAFSARWNDGVDANQESRPTRAEQTDIPSSPPLSQGDRNAAGYQNAMADYLLVEPKTPLRLSSPVTSQHGDADLQQHRRGVRGLTSSVVKGEAANSLLALVRGGNARAGGAGVCSV